MSIDGAVTCFASFHNVNCPKGFLYFNKGVSAMELKILRKEQTSLLLCNSIFFTSILVLKIYQPTDIIEAIKIRITVYKNTRKIFIQVYRGKSKVVERLFPTSQSLVYSLYEMSSKC